MLRRNLGEKAVNCSMPRPPTAEVRYCECCNTLLTPERDRRRQAQACWDKLMAGYDR